MKLLVLALAPVFIIAFYIYLRDKYEKEPIKVLLKALLFGCLVPIPVLLIGSIIGHFKPDGPGGLPAFYNAFVIAAINEEFFKFAALFILIWKHKEFNEKFDGIVYAVFISLGFAGVENIIYVFQYGETTGYTRALTAVPAHALFGVCMGFYFGLAKFYPKQRKLFMTRAIFYPIVLHGTYDFILMLGDKRLMVLFLPFVVFLYIDGLRKMKNLSDRSVYRK